MNPTKTPPAPHAPAASATTPERAAPPIPAAAELPVTPVTPEEGMRYYTAILGREPTLDPEAPDLLPGMNREGGGSRTWVDDLAILRDDISRKLQATLKRRPNWRELMDAMTVAASRRIDEARKRLEKRDAA